MDPSTYFAPYEPTPARIGPVLPFTVEPAQPADVPDLVDLVVARDGGDPERQAARFHTQLQDPERRIYVARTASGPVGFGRAASLRPEPGPRPCPEGWYLLGLIVAPTAWRAGVGRALTTARLDWLRGRTREVFYFADAGNAASIALHAGFGFEELTREFDPPGVTFSSGAGVLFRLGLEL